MFGAFVEGIDLSRPEDITPQVRESLIADTHKYRLLIFKNDGKHISADAQLEVSRWFGEIESTFYKHPASPHADIFRVSNVEAHGCRNVGRSGWHIDGSFMNKPFKIQTMHFWANCIGGNTLFSPINELIESMSEEERKEWE